MAAAGNTIGANSPHDPAPWHALFTQLLLERVGYELTRLTKPLQAFIAERVRATNHAQESDYIEGLQNLPNEATEWQRIIDAVTNGLTHFFRDPEQIAMVGDLMLQTHKRHPERPLRIWSAGCSTGEEAYTLAIVASHQRIDDSLEILGTDINTHALRTARKASYDPWTLREVEEDIRARHFRQQGSHMKLMDRHRQGVHFASHNLTKNTPPVPTSGYWDFIICRNVLIYYDRPVVEHILKTFASVLAKGGFLVLGASESIHGFQVPLYSRQHLGRVVFTKAPLRKHTGSTGHLLSTDIRVTPIARRTTDLHTSSLVRKRTQEPETLGYTCYSDIVSTLRERLEADDVDGAIKALECVLVNNSSEIIAHLSLGHCFLLQHHFQNAKKAYGEAENIDGLSLEAQFFLGIVARRQAKIETAMKHFRKVLFLQPSFWLASYHLASCAQRTGDTTTAKREWQRTGKLIMGGQDTMPFITDPVTHAQFIADPREVLQLAQDQLRKEGETVP